MAETATDRILKWAANEIGVDVVDWITPAVAEALVVAIRKTSKEAKVGLVYGMLNKKIGSVLNTGPDAAAPLIDILETVGIKREHAIETLGNFITALDAAIQKQRPN